ncbi:hypothetical protein ACEPAI_4329 [Sanghuangporus weigelae]
MYPLSRNNGNQIRSQVAKRIPPPSRDRELSPFVKRKAGDSPQLAKHVLPEDLFGKPDDEPPSPECNHEDTFMLKRGKTIPLWDEQSPPLPTDLKRQLTSWKERHFVEGVIIKNGVYLEFLSSILAELPADLSYDFVQEGEDEGRLIVSGDPKYPIRCPAEFNKAAEYVGESFVDVFIGAMKACYNTIILNYDPTRAGANLDVSGETRGPDNPNPDRARSFIPDGAMYVNGQPVVILEVASSQTPQDIMERGEDWFRNPMIKLAILVKVWEKGKHKPGPMRGRSPYIQAEQHTVQWTFQQFTSKLRESESGDLLVELEGTYRKFASPFRTRAVLLWRTGENEFTYSRSPYELDVPEHVERMNTRLAERTQNIRQALGLHPAWTIQFNVAEIVNGIAEQRDHAAYHRYAHWFRDLGPRPKPEVESPPSSP